jgi:hypothetical protein
MVSLPRSDLFHGLFELLPAPGDVGGAQGRPRLASNAAAPRAIPDPQTGRPLKVASLELSERGVCPACTQLGAGGYVSFVADLRLAFACPSCRKLVWIAGA